MGRVQRVITGLGVAAGLMASSAVGANAASDTIKIGLVMPYSGWFQPIDEGTIKGAELAVDDINAKGGVIGKKLKIISFDMKSKPPLGANGAIQLISQGAKLIIVPSDFDFGGPGAFVAQQKGVVTMAGASDPKFGAKGIGKFAFSMSNASFAEGATLAEWTYKKKGWKKAYVLLDNTISYTKTLCAGFKTRFKQLGGDKALLGDDKFMNKDPSIATQITRIKSLPQKPDVIMLCSYAPGGPSAIRQLRAAGINTPIVTGNSMDGDYWLGAVPKLSNFYVTNFGSKYGDDSDPKVNAFFQRYKKKFGSPSTTSYSIRGYSMVQAFAIAVQRAGTTNGNAVVAQLDKFNKEPLMIGPTTFTATHRIGVKRPVTIMKATNGKFSFVTRFAPEVVPGMTK
jgi:branched-chain amino acid transport system substrate-binding protein